MKYSISFLSSNYSIEETIRRIDETDCDYIHVDVMDGKFVNNTSLSKEDIIKYLSDTKKELDVHLMVNDPSDYLETLTKTKCRYVTFHYEAVNDVMGMINLIKSYGFKCGISIKPNTLVSDIREYLPYVDMVLVMSVEPGMGGQEFIMSSTNKIHELKRLGNFIVNVDGGINNETIKLVESDMVVSGSYICRSDDYQAQLNKLKGKLVLCQIVLVDKYFDK